MEDRCRISVVLSFRNEEDVLPELVRRLRETLGPLPLEYELIFVNDASTDGSLSLLRDCAGEDRRIKIITMSRRFGVAECIIAGMEYSSGDAVIYLDTDLQDPPEVIPELFAEWRKGADVVYTVRKRRKGESPLRFWLTQLAYRLIHASSREVDLKVEAGDFKLLSRRVVDILLRLPEKNPYIRGLIPWIGFKQVPVYYERQKRAAGKGHFPLFRNFLSDLLTFKGTAGTFAIGLTSFSLLPLVVFILIGLFLCLISLVGLAVVLALYLIRLSPSATVVFLFAMGLFSGVQLLGIGTVGLYLGRVYNDVRNRPRYLVESTVGFDEDIERPRNKR